MATATLMAHCGARKVSLAELEGLPTPECTKTFTPIKHFALITAIKGELAGRGYLTTREQYAVQHEDHRLFGVMDLTGTKNGEVGPSLGLRTANDKSMSIQLMIGNKVFVCDNLAFSGSMIIMRQKHYGNLDLARQLPEALDRFEGGLARMEQDIDRLKNSPLYPGAEKGWIFDIFRKKVVPLRLFPQVIETYHEVSVPRHGANLWALHNAVTQNIHQLRPGPAFQATFALGQALGMR